MVVIKDVVPTFFVQDTCRSAAWYQRVLGGKVAFESGGYCGVDLGSARIHLAQVEAPPPRGTSYKGAFYLRLESGVDELVARIEAAGQALTATLKNHDYGMREATVRDPDGNDIYVGQPT